MNDNVEQIQALRGKLTLYHILTQVFWLSNEFLIRCDEQELNFNQRKADPYKMITSHSSTQLSSAEDDKATKITVTYVSYAHSTHLKFYHAARRDKQ